jgi:hypothetical protein
MAISLLVKIVARTGVEKGKCPVDHEKIGFYFLNSLGMKIGTYNSKPDVSIRIDVYWQEIRCPYCKKAD